MDPASAAPEAGSAGIPAAPRTPASSLPFAGRSQIAAPPPAGSSPLHTPLAAPARTVPRLSSLRPLPILAEDLLLPDFCSGPAGLSGRSMRDYLSGALRFPQNQQFATHRPSVRSVGGLHWKPSGAHRASERVLDIAKAPTSRFGASARPSPAGR